MIGRHWIRRRAAGPVLGLCALLATGGCGNTEIIVSGHEFLNSGSMKVSALGPTCGCLSLRNHSPREIMLESTFYGVPLGTVLLAPQEQTRVLFDWAGAENQDFYLIDAYAVDDQQRRGGKLKMSELVSQYAPFVETQCDDQTCQFGGLAMNRVIEDAEELEQEHPTRGIEFTSVIAASAPLDECGCLMLTNFSAHDLTIRATLHGTQTGQMDLSAGVTVPISFDWAGTLDNDAYIIDAVDVRTPGDPPLAANSPANAPGAATSPTDRPGSAMTVRLKDYVKIDGTLVNMTCAADFAEFVNHRTPNLTEAMVRCPWKPGNSNGLGMRVAYDKRTQQSKIDAAGTPTPAPKPAR
ncbi:MAG: hypothetical protein FJW22_06005 [Acidimicrobiia bacterium]|nr:hypothetical protein [Acidimicrobiia bacterium]